MRRRWKGSLAALVVSATAWPLAVSAHHHPVNFLSSVVAIHGEVTDVEWKNPHVYIYLKAVGEDGSLVVWEIETGSTPSLTRRGWTPDTIKPGDLITVRGNPDRNPERKFLSAEAITKTDGTVLALRGASAASAGVPQARASSLEGVWLSLGSPYDRSKPALHLPLTDKGKAAAAAFDVAKDPFAQCVPPPVPDSLSTPYLHEIVFNGDEIILREEYWEVERIVHMDQRSHPADAPRTNQGHSIGWWDGNVLVVDTTLFADHGYGNGSGIPSGARKHIVERYALTDDNTTITIDYVLEDPEYLAEPVRDTRKWRYTPRLELLPNQCDLETAQRYIGGLR